MHHCFAIREKISRSIGRQLAAGHLLALPRAWDQDREQYGYTWDKRRWCSQWIEQKHFPLWVQTFQRFPRPNGLVLGATKGHDSSQKLSDAVHSWQFGPLINRPHRSPWSHVFMSWVPWVGVSWKLSFSSPNTLVIGVLLPGGPFLPPPLWRNFNGTSWSEPWVTGARSMAENGRCPGWRAFWFLDLQTLDHLDLQQKVVVSKISFVFRPLFSGGGECFSNLTLAHIFQKGLVKKHQVVCQSQVLICRDLFSRQAGAFAEASKIRPGFAEANWHISNFQAFERWTT